MLFDNRSLISRVIGAMIVCTVLCSTSQALAAERLALVIGNGDYEQAPLRNPANDAQDVAVKLEQYGFEVTLLLDEGQRTMEQEIRRFTTSLHEDTVGLFYFAGHGIQVGGENYLIPVDADIVIEEDVRYEGVELGRIIDGMRYGPGRLNLVILDACRNNPYSRRFRSAERGLAKSSPARGTMIMYATEPGNVAADGSDRNGIFTGALLETIDEDDSAGIESLFKRTSVKVNDLTNGVQAPWSEGIIYGDFAFAEKTPIDNVEPVTNDAADSTSSKDNPDNGNIELAELPASNIDALMWQSAERYDNLAAYRAYVEAFPGGIFVKLAEVRINQLEEQQSEQLQAQEQSSQEQAAEAEKQQIELAEEQQRIAREEQLALLEQQQLASENAQNDNQSEKPLADPVSEDSLPGLAERVKARPNNKVEQSILLESQKVAEDQRRINLLKQTEDAIGMDNSDRVRVQLTLNSMDLDVGAADGRWGPRTRAGIKQWQAENEIEDSGYLNQSSYKILLAEIPQDLQKTTETFSYEPEMVLIPGGSFTMGNNRGARNQRPARTVGVASFEMSRFEITFAQFEEFARAERSPAPDDHDWGRGNRPVIMVTWEEAQAYTAWLSRVTGKAYRLPTEAEWEYAARAGSDTAYSFGDSSKEICKYANSDDVSCDSYKFTAPVGSFKANAFGLYDMHGNVGEWVEDCWHANYKGAPNTARAWIDNGRCGTRVMRGGSWSNSPANLRSTSRTGHTVVTRKNAGGFRVARTIRR